LVWEAVLHWVKVEDAGSRSLWQFLLSGEQGELLECGADPILHGQVAGDCVVAAAQVLREGVPGSDGPRRGQAFASAHRPQPRVDSAVIGFDQRPATLL
jgi:hypothetical protein